MNLRPSILPKLAACAKYVSNPVAGAAADRGTRMDEAFRAALMGKPITLDDSEDQAAVDWAVATAHIYAGGQPVEADEANLKVSVLGMEGTADAACFERGWSADLKSGEIRNYHEQQAAYALGFMEREFCDEWQVHLFYADQRRVETLVFDRRSAEETVSRVIAKAKDELAKATPCEYCDWCAKRWSCATRLEPLSQLLFGAPDKLDVPAISEDPAMLGAVLAITHEVAKDGGLHDTLKTAAKVHLEAGRDVSGWGLTKGRETQTVDSVTVARWASELGILKVVTAFGNMSLSKFSELWRNTFGDRPLPTEGIKTNHGSPFVSKFRKKK